MQSSRKSSRMDAKALQAAAWVGCMGILFLLCGCVTASKKGRTWHERRDYQVVQQPDGETVALLICDELWEDEWKGSLHALLDDPSASQVESIHTNQTALGGSSTFTVGAMRSEVSTNSIIATGAAGSQIIQGIGAAVGQAANKAVTGTPVK